MLRPNSQHARSILLRATLVSLSTLIAVVDSRAAELAISIDKFAFSPQLVVVRAGTSVTWTNRDDIPHTVVASGKAFRSKALDTGDTFSFTFTTPGSYEYFCSLHPHMTGTIVVQAANESPSSP